jgi:hypothetical protein
MWFSSHNAKHNCKTIFLADWNVRERCFVVRNYQHIKVHLWWITIPSIMPHPSPQHQSSQIFTRNIFAPSWWSKPPIVALG